MNDANRMTGLIRKSIGGFYYVEAADQIWECKARGIFRKEGISPCAGDRVEFSPGDQYRGTVEEILSRRNFLKRPPVANADQLVVVVSVCDPSPNFLNIDKMAAIAESKSMEPILIVSKTDLQDTDEIRDIYRLSGIPYFEISARTGEGIEQLDSVFRHKLSVLIGNSGVGKSSLLNCMGKDFSLETGAISQKLGRGRHTTRQVELLKLSDDTYVADTPGFSTIDMTRYDVIHKEELASCFREFEDYRDQCRFLSCSHTCEKGCAVIAAVKEGKIHPSRHKSYCAIYDQIKDWKEWEKK